MKLCSFLEGLSGPVVLHACFGSRFRVSLRSPVRSSFQTNRAAWRIRRPTDRICGMMILHVDDMLFAEAQKNQKTPGSGETTEKTVARKVGATRG